MLLQTANAAIAVLFIIIAIVIVTLVLYLAVKVIESEQRANDKKLMIVLIAIICVIVLPIILAVCQLILGLVGGGLAAIRSALDGGGRNMLVMLVPIIGFIIVLVLIRFLIDLTWESSLWIALLMLFILFIMYSLAPELYSIVGV